MIAMKNINIKNFLYLLIPLSGAAWFLVAIYNGYDLQSVSGFLKPLPKVITFDVFAIGCFVKWAWKWKIFHGWLVPFPNLNGTWIGDMQTTWKDANGNTPGPIPTMLTIKQSFLGISCVMRTGEMMSYSFVEGFCIDNERQVCQICYSYTSKPSSCVQGRSAQHDGTALFNIIGNPPTKLKGDYWTQRKTTGSMSLVLKTRELLSEIPSDFPEHPMSPS